MATCSNSCTQASFISDIRIWTIADQKRKDFAKFSDPTAPPGLPNTQFPTAAQPDPIKEYLEHLFEAIADLLKAGLEHINAHTIQIWQNLYEQSKLLNFTTLLKPLLQLIKLLKLKNNTLNWNHHLAAREALKLTLYAKLIQDQ